MPAPAEGQSQTFRLRRHESLRFVAIKPFAIAVMNVRDGELRGRADLRQYAQEGHRVRPARSRDQDFFLEKPRRFKFAPNPVLELVLRFQILSDALNVAEFMNAE